MVTGSKKDVEHVGHLCKMGIDRGDRDCERVAQVAQNVVFGRDEMTRGAGLGIKLCQMCIEKRSDAIAFIT